MNSTKLFGLDIACKIAADTIKRGATPMSIILHNMLVLQKSKIFPSELNSDYFSQPIKGQSFDSRVVSAFMDELKKSSVSVDKFLYTLFSNGWIQKTKQQPIKKVQPVVKNEKKRDKTNQNRTIFK